MKSAKEILTSSGKFHIKLGLERTLDALYKLGNPQDKMEFIHVAGTNGKGSVCAILDRILREHFKDSKKIGLFTSPHLFSYTERIKIDGKAITKADLDYYINLVSTLNSELTEFEILTVAAFKYFFDNNVNYVVLEVGLGGRFDSTNVIKKPLASIITTIDFDHTERLGKTTDEIAYQKAGIIKPYCSVVCAKSNIGYNVIKKYCDEISAKLYEANEDIRIKFENGENFACFNNRKCEFSLLGSYQAKNLALALKCLEVLPFKIEETTVCAAIKDVYWPFRLEYIKEKSLLLDGAHNPSGAKVLRDFLEENFANQKITFLFGCLKNKDYENMLETLIKEGDELYFYEFDYPNALKFDQLPQKFIKIAKKCTNPNDLIDNHSGLLVVCGSLYMLGSIFSKKTLSDTR